MRQRCANELELDWEIFRDEMVPQESAFWMQVKRRSVFGDAATIQLVAIMEKSGRDPDDEYCKGWLADNARTLMSSHAVEGGVRIVRRKETSAVNQKQSCQSICIGVWCNLPSSIKNSNIRKLTGTATSMTQMECRQTPFLCGTPT